MKVLYQTDNNYAAYMGISMLSLFENNQMVEELTVYIIDDGINQENIEKIKNLGEKYKRQIVFISAISVLEDEKNKEVFSYVGFRKNKHSYLKLYIGNLLPELCGRLIYIDCDTVVTGSLEELETIPMQGKVIGMVQDSLIGKSKTSIGLADTDRYYNSGVILFDLELWKKKDCFRRIVNHICNVRTYGTVDQDVLNMELKNEIATLPMRFNVQSIHMAATAKQFTNIFKHRENFYSMEEIETATQKPIIVHFLRFIGEHPWDEKTVHPDKEYYDTYWKLSPWKDMKKHITTNGILFKIERMMYLTFPRNLFLMVFHLVHERMVRKSNRLPK